MKLSRWNCLVLVLVIPLACHEEPTTPTVEYPYVLQNVGGQPLPAILYASTGDTTTIVTSSVTLAPAGKATIVERIRRVQPGMTAATNDYTSLFNYRLIGDSVAFDYVVPCPINAICVAPPGGKLLGLRLTISFGNPSYRPPFQYFRFLPD